MYGVDPAKGNPVSTPPTPAVAATFPILLVIVAGFALAGMDGIAKLLSGFGFPVLFVLWGRYFFHSFVTFVAYAGSTRSFDFLWARRPGLQLIRAASLFGATSTFYVSLTQMPLGDAASIQFLAPVLVTAISGIFLGEHVGARRWTAVVFAFVGVIIVSRPGTGVFGVWALLPLVTAVLLAIYMILTRTIRDKDEPATTTFYTTAVGAGALTLALPWLYTPMAAIDWGLMILMGSLGALGHFLLVQAFHRAEASALAPFTYAQVVAAIVLGFLLFGDAPSSWTVVGASMIIGSGVYVWYRERQQAARDAA